MCQRSQFSFIIGVQINYLSLVEFQSWKLFFSVQTQLIPVI